MAMIAVVLTGFTMYLAHQVGRMRWYEYPLEQHTRQVQESQWEVLSVVAAAARRAGDHQFDVFEEECAHLEEHLAGYMELAATEEERAAGERYRAVWEEMKRTGRAVFDDVAVKKEAGDLFFEYVDRADDVLDFGVQARFLDDDPLALEKERAVREVEVSVWEAIHAAEQYVGLSGDVARADHAQRTFAELMEKQFDDVERFWGTYSGLVETEAEREVVRAFDALWAVAVEQGRTVVRYHDRINHGVARLAELAEEADAISDDEILEAIGERVAARDRASSQGQTAAMFLLVGALVGVASIIGSTVQAVCGPLARLKEAAEAYGEGRLGHRINATEKDEIGDVSRAFDEMGAQLEASSEVAREKERVEAQSRAKSEFLAAMSHELRTPLNGVLGMTELLRGTELDSRQRRFVEACRKSGTSLLELINDILDLSKIEAGRLELEDQPISITQCVNDTVAMMAARAHASKLELCYFVDPALDSTVRGDSVRLRQILVNLMSNAIKFTESGHVLVRATPEDISDDEMTVRFSVRDTGIGIAPEGVCRLFESFSQVERSTTRRYGGTGLGLSISRSLAEAMGGSMGVESAVGVGSTFWFTATFRRGSESVVPEPMRPEDLRSLRTLIVDDHAPSRRILRETLLSWTEHVDATGIDDPALVGKERAEGFEAYDIAIFNLPVSDDGSEAMVRRALEADDPVAQRALTLVSTEGGDALEGVRATMDVRSIRKPPSRSELLDAIMSMCCGTGSGRDVGAPTDGRREEMLLGNVLLVEDHPTNSMFLTEILEEAGLTVTVAWNGREAVETVRRGAPDGGPFDVVLMDCEMPEMNGFEAARALRELEAQGELAGKLDGPIIAVTANAIKGDRERCLEAGMNDYISKPVDPEVLFDKLRRCLSSGEGAAAIAVARGAAAAERSATAYPVGGGEEIEGGLGKCVESASALASALEEFLSHAPRYVARGELDGGAGGDAGEMLAEMREIDRLTDRLGRVCRATDRRLRDGAERSTSA